MLIHIHSVLADTDAFEAFLLRQNPLENLSVALTSPPILIIADVNLLNLHL